MMAALVWKEYREQRGVWLTLALLAALVLAGLPLAYQPEAAAERDFREGLLAVAGALAWTHALVCGAMLLAGETEAGTQGVLDALPAPRLALWLGKLAAGLALVAGQVALLAALAGPAGLPEQAPPWLVAAGLAAVGLHGLSWGMLCSARASTVLGAVGLALLCNLALVPAAALALACPLGALAYLAGLPVTTPALVVAVLALTLLVPLPLSALSYTRLDRARRGGREAAISDPGQRFSPWRQAAWLAWRQSRGLLAGLLLFALVAGALIIGRGLLLWPALTAGIGALCGVTAFMDEQNGPARFLGDQRFPLGRLWLVKLGGRAAVGLLALLALLLPLVVASAVRLSTNLSDGRHLPVLTDTLGGPALAPVLPLGLFFCGPLLIGLAVGHFFGLLFRKALVALVVAVGLALLLAAAWWPSLIAGGVHGWQVLGAVPVLLLGARALLPAWAGDRLLSWGGAARIAAACAAALGVTAAGLWYRAVELPDVEEPAGYRTWLAGLAALDEAPASRHVRAGVVRFDDARRGLQGRRPTKPLIAEGQPTNTTEGFLQQCRFVAARGWPAGADELAAWLDEVFAGDWHAELARAAPLPVGLAEHPVRFDWARSHQSYDAAGAAGAALAARGLQRQRLHDDPGAFVGHLEAGLALSRNLAHNSTMMAAWAANDIERLQLRALEWWLEGLRGRPDLLRRALAAVRRHAELAPRDPVANRMAEYLVATEALAQPASLGPYDGPVLGLGQPEADAALLRGAWSVPWERARRERLLRLAFWGGDRFPPPGHVQLFLIAPNALSLRRREAPRPRGECRRAAAVVQAALRLYEAEKGRPAARLGELVPAYLAEVPADPYSGRAFGYRVSQGEVIARPRAAEQGWPVAAGQGVLWSVGEDGGDDGGRRQGRGEDDEGRSGAGEDLIWLVPRPAGR